LSRPGRATDCRGSFEQAWHQVHKDPGFRLIEALRWIQARSSLTDQERDRSCPWWWRSFAGYHDAGLAGLVRPPRRMRSPTCKAVAERLEFGRNSGRSRCWFRRLPPGDLPSPLAPELVLRSIACQARPALITGSYIRECRREFRDPSRASVRLAVPQPTLAAGDPCPR